VDYCALVGAGFFYFYTFLLDTVLLYVFAFIYRVAQNKPDYTCVVQGLHFYKKHVSVIMYVWHQTH